MARPVMFDRDEALDAIMRCFWEYGFEATSLDRIEKATGLKRQSLYNAYGDKVTMFTASLERYRMQVGTPLRALLDHDDPRSAVRAYIEGHLMLLTDPSTPAGCMMAGCSSELGPRNDSIGAMMRGETAAALEVGAEVFRDWQSNGKLGPEADPEQLAAFLAVVVRGLGVLARSSDTPGAIAHAVDGALWAFDQLLVAQAHNGLPGHGK